jgi:hypothetical protein
VLDQGQQILEGIADTSIPNIYGVKMYGEVFRSSARYLGFTADAFLSDLQWPNVIAGP